MDNIQKYVQHFDAQYKRSIGNDSAFTEIKSDGYGGSVIEIETSCYTRKDYDDGSFVIQQLNIGLNDRTIKFGPLTTKLSDLFAMGFILKIQGWKHSRNQKLVLIRGNERYKLAKIPTSQLNQYQDLTMWVKDYTKPHFDPYTVEPKLKQIIKEVRIETDPFEQLTLRYPVRRKTVEFVGNQTLEQYVKQQLREQRRLENVV
jgi:hypothetical protein